MIPAKRNLRNAVALGALLLVLGAIPALARNGSTVDPLRASGTGTGGGSIPAVNPGPVGSALGPGEIYSGSNPATVVRVIDVRGRAIGGLSVLARSHRAELEVFAQTNGAGIAIIRASAGDLSAIDLPEFGIEGLPVPAGEAMVIVLGVDTLSDS